MAGTAMQKTPRKRSFRASRMEKQMVNERTSAAMHQLLKDLPPHSASPKEVQAGLQNAGYSVYEIQDAFQLALSQGLVETDDQMLVRRRDHAA